VNWGDGVKASFDTFLPELGRKLGFPSTATYAEEKYLWYLFSNVNQRRSERALNLFKSQIEELSQVVPEDSTKPSERI